MNRIEAVITNVESSGNVSLIHLRAGDIKLTSVILDASESSPFVQAGHTVNAIFKETEATIALSAEGISLRNRIPGKIKEVESGKLLCRVTVKSSAGLLHALITSASATELDLKPGDPIFVLVKTNELMLSE